jgi:hypothetical protein
MSEQAKQLRIEGIVHGHRGGKQSLPGPTTIECSDGKQWVVDYNEQSPFHAFAGRHVLVSGEPYTPTGSHLISRDRERPLGHLKVSTMRLIDMAEDAELVEVGPGQHLTGRFERSTSGGESTLSFLTENDTFRVANDPAGAAVDNSVRVWARPVQLGPSVPAAPERCLWIICPCPMADLWAWNERRS